MGMVTHGTTGSESRQVDLDELARLAARDYIAVALEAERRAYLEAHADLLDDHGHRLVVGHGYGRPRQVVTVAGAIEVEAPRVRDRREGSASPRRCYRRTCGARQRWVQSCRCSTCTGCRRETSSRRCGSSSAPRQGSRHRRSHG